MSESIGSADDESVKSVTLVQASAGSCVTVVATRAIGEIGWPVCMGTGKSFAVFVNFVIEGVGMVIGRHRSCRGVGLVVRWGCDSHAEFDLLAESATEHMGDLSAQMTFDLVLHERVRHRQQCKPFNDGEWPRQVQPSPLLGRQGGDGGLIGDMAMVGGSGVVEFGDDRSPHGREAETGVIGQRGVP